MSWLDKLRQGLDKLREPMPPTTAPSAEPAAPRRSAPVAPSRQSDPIHAEAAATAAARDGAPPLRLSPAPASPMSPAEKTSWSNTEASGMAVHALKLAPRATAGPPPPSLPSFTVGQRIADTYEVKRVLSRGGPNAVYLTHHDRWNIDVVVKVPNAELLGEGDGFDHIKAGAEKWIGLGMHPHVAYCHYVHILDGVPLLVVEHLERGTLRSWLVNEQRPDLRAALDLALQLCHGLEHAHSRGVVHRAIKPENLLFAADGTIKLTDFGVATSVKTTGKSTATKDTSKVSPAATAVADRRSASPYVAPEQWVDDDGVDARADVFALGVCLYEMLCGRRPFDLARGPRREPPDPGEAWNDTSIPKRLAKLLVRCIDWDRDRRPWSVTEVRQELAAVYATLFDQPSVFSELPEGSPEADGWNNRALSHLMLDQPDAADAAWESALVADPKHLEATYNRGLVRWRRGEATDHALIHALQQARPRRHEAWRAQYLLAMVQLERGAVDEALDLLQTAARQAPEDGEVGRALERVQAEDFVAARCLNVIEGHTNYVTSLAISGDGRLAVSGSNDHSLRLWDVPTGRCLRVLEGHQQHVLSVAISADGRLALSGADDEPLRLWEAASGRCLRVFGGSCGRVYGVALSGDGRFALSTGAQSPRGFDVGAVQLWDTESGRPLNTLYGHSSAVKAIAVTADGRWALSGSDDRTARLWDVATGRCLRVLEGHQHHVSAVAISPDGHTALTGSWDETLRTWDLQTGRCLRSFEGHRGMVTSVYLLAGGRRALSASWDATLRLWETPEGTEEICSLRASHPAGYTRCGGAAGTQDDRGQSLLQQAAEALEDARYPTALETLRELRAFEGSATSPSTMQAWRQLSLVCSRVGLQAARPGKVLAEPDAVCATWLSADGRSAVSGSRDHRLRLWDLEAGQCVRVFEGHGDRISSAGLSPDGRWLLSASHDRTLRLWEVASGRCLRVLTGHASLVTSACFSSDGRRALSGSYDHTLRLWEVTTGCCLRVFRGHTRQVTSACLSADGRLALSGSYDRSLRLWDVETGECLRRLEGHSAQVTAVQISADGRRAVSGARDRALRLWEIASGECLHTFEGHGEAVSAVALSQDGRWALSAGNDRTLRVWDLTMRRCHAMIEGLGDSVRAVSLSDDTCWLMVGGADKTLRLWELDWELEARDAAESDPGVQPFLETFLTLHAPLRLDVAAEDGTAHQVEASWNDQDFQRLIWRLQYAGYGWLRPEGIRRELRRMLADWPGPGTRGRSHDQARLSLSS